MSDRYAVVGHPISHSKSPRIHTLFAAQTGEDLVYTAIEAPLDGFAATAQAFMAAGGRGLNVTVPFKEEAFRMATRLSPRAEAAGAVNTLKFQDGAIFGDNTDGAGLVRDITINADWPIAGKKVLILGAGGAAAGVLQPLLDAQPALIRIANRTLEKAERLVARVKDPRLTALTMTQLADTRFDLVINATASSLQGEPIALPDAALAPGCLVYDMMYGAAPTAFLQMAHKQGALIRDGLGMLVEQAAETFFVWRGIRPETAPVLAALRKT